MQCADSALRAVSRLILNRRFPASVRILPFKNNLVFALLSKGGPGLCLRSYMTKFTSLGEKRWSMLSVTPMGRTSKSKWNMPPNSCAFLFAMTVAELTLKCYGRDAMGIGG